MKSIISGVKISSICAVVPARVLKFEDELKEFPFPESSSRRLGKVMGFREHRIADPKTTLIDLAAYGINCLFKEGVIKKEDIDCLVFSSQVREHLVPGNSKVLHGFLNLSRNTHCIDLYENCTGFISGLYTACSIMRASNLNCVLLVVSNSGCCYANKKDRNTYPLAGDAAGIAVISRSDEKETIDFAFFNDSDLRDNLITPAGGMRMPATEETAKMHIDDMGNYRSLNQLHMDGTGVFHYVMENVPFLIKEICELADVKKEDIKYHLTHQPNRFMLEKLADLINVPREIMFNNIVENFGNSSSSTIPVNIAYNLSDKLIDNSYKVCLSAFGAGMSVAGAIMNLGKMDYCKLIEHPCNGSNEY